MSFIQKAYMGWIAIVIFVADQWSKYIVLEKMPVGQEVIVIDGFFKWVHWENTGAAWSLFSGNSEVLAIISLVAMMALFIFRRHFDGNTTMGKIALGLLFGGILGNLYDRLHPERGHVIDFIYFYVQRRSGGESGFPAFNIADSAICISVGLLLIISWREDIQERMRRPAPEAESPSSSTT